MHLQEQLCRAKEFHVEAVFDKIFKRFLDGMVASKIKHVIDKEEEAQPLPVRVIGDKKDGSV